MLHFSMLCSRISESSAQASDAPGCKIYIRLKLQKVNTKKMLHESLERATASLSALPLLGDAFLLNIPVSIPSLWMFQFMNKILFTFCDNTESSEHLQLGMGTLRKCLKGKRIILNCLIRIKTSQRSSQWQDFRIIILSIGQTAYWSLSR